MELNGGNVVLTGNEDAKATGELTLNPLDPNASNAADRFSNTATIKLGDKIYTLHIRQLLKPQIKLNYGNSPYGEIMKDAGIVDKDTAKKRFLKAVDGGAYSFKYHPSYTPAGVKYKNRFDIRAWVNLSNLSSPTPEEELAINNPEINMDINPTALFIYNEQAFKDPGFKLIDSLGKVVEAEKITTGVKRQIVVNRMDKPKGVEALKDTKITQDNVVIPNLGAIAEIESVTPLRNIAPIVRPDIYVMKYEYTDANGQNCEAERKIIILHKLGDTDFNKTMNDSDGNIITRFVNSSSLLDGVKESAKLVYLYRLLDLDQNETVNDSDENVITRNIVSGTDLLSYYELAI